VADNVAITAGTGTTIAADEVVDATLGTVKVQYVKLMDGTLNGVEKATVKGAGIAAVAADPALVVAISPNSVNANGQTTMANSAPVVIASNQSAFPVNLSATTTGGVSRSRTLVPNNTTAVVVKSGAGQLYKIRATNNSGTIAYIKLYDATGATVGTGTPVDTIMIPGNSSGGAGIVDTTDLGVVHTTGITFIVTTGIADNDTGVPAASTYVVTLYYK
jgi:hypothetical protein